jgi:ABC-type transport system involved in multi-copper enzyme maturation permease subunit
MLIKMLAVERKKLLEGRLFWGALAVLLAIGASVFFFMFTTRNSGSFSVEERLEVTVAVTWPQSLFGALLMVAQLGAPILLALVGALVAQEYGWRTVALWLSHGVPRATVLLARFLCVLGAVLAATAALFLVIAAMSAWFTILIYGALDVSSVNFWEALLGIMRTTYTLTPYIGLVFLGGVLTRSIVGAIGSGVLFVLIVEPVMIEIMGALGGSFLTLRMFLPDMLATSVFQLNTAIATVPFPTGMEDAPELLGAGPAAVLIALYTVVLLGCSIWIFRRQDLAA